MKTDDKIRDEKLQYGINREATKISAFQLYRQVKLINIYSFQTKKSCHLIKVE